MINTKKYVGLKVFVNKRNGQATVILPKKKIKKIPKRVMVRW
jgi:hypothetical protein